MVIYYWLCGLLDQILYNSLCCVFLSFVFHPPFLSFFLSRSLPFLVAFILLSFLSLLCVPVHVYFSDFITRSKWSFSRVFTVYGATDCDDIQIDVLINWFEYKTHKKSRSISSEMEFDIRLLLLHTLRTVRVI